MKRVSKGHRPARRGTQPKSGRQSHRRNTGRGRVRRMNDDELRIMLSGQVEDPSATHLFVREQLIPPAVEQMNTDMSPYYLNLFDTDKDFVPQNQANLTDVRGRVSILLEFQLCQAITNLLPPVQRKSVALTYVIANRFPDLEFRTAEGEFG